jgi:hypothetical protein
MNTRQSTSDALQHYISKEVFCFTTKILLSLPLIKLLRAESMLGERPASEHTDEELLHKDQYDVPASMYSFATLPTVLFGSLAALRSMSPVLRCTSPKVSRSISHCSHCNQMVQQSVHQHQQQRKQDHASRSQVRVQHRDLLACLCQKLGLLL